MIPLIQSCDDCGKTLFYITGTLSEELHDIINNDERFVDNTAILCPECLKARADAIMKVLK